MVVVELVVVAILAYIMSFNTGIFLLLSVVFTDGKQKIIIRKSNCFA